MKKLIKRLFGVDKMEADLAEKEAKLAEKEKVELSPKEIATEKKEPWIAVLDTHVNMDNIRNGFFELDWNEYFVLQLRSNGYQGATDEEVVDLWFGELCRNIGSDEGVDMSRRGAGYINVNNLGNGRTEVS